MTTACENAECSSATCTNDTWGHTCLSCEAPFCENCIIDLGMCGICKPCEDLCEDAFNDIVTKIESWGIPKDEIEPFEGRLMGLLRDHVRRLEHWQCPDCKKLIVQGHEALCTQCGVQMCPSHRPIKDSTSAMCASCFKEENRKYWPALDGYEW